MKHFDHLGFTLFKLHKTLRLILLKTFPAVKKENRGGSKNTKNERQRDLSLIACMYFIHSNEIRVRASFTTMYAINYGILFMYVYV